MCGCLTMEAQKPAEYTAPIQKNVCSFHQDNQFCPKEGFVVCPSCKFCFCITHRHADQHNCIPTIQADLVSKQIKEEVKESKQAIIDRIRARAIEETKQKNTGAVSEKQAKINAKVMRMKVKSSAQGNQKVPKEHRFAIRLVLSLLGECEQIKNQFFDDRMNLGQVIDALRTELGFSTLPVKVMWDDTLVEFTLETVLSDLTTKH